MKRTVIYFSSLILTAITLGQVVTSPLHVSKHHLTVSLDLAVDEFNLSAQKSEIGKKQPPLTKIEVISSLALVGSYFSSETVGTSIDQYIEEVIKTEKLPAYASLAYFQGVGEGLKSPPVKCWTIYIEFETNKPVVPHGKPRPRALIRHTFEPIAK